MFGTVSEQHDTRQGFLSGKICDIVHFFFNIRQTGGRCRYCPSLNSCSTLTRLTNVFTNSIEIHQLHHINNPAQKAKAKPSYNPVLLRQDAQCGARPESGTQCCYRGRGTSASVLLRTSKVGTPQTCPARSLIGLPGVLIDGLPGVYLCQLRKAARC